MLAGMTRRPKPQGDQISPPLDDLARLPAPVAAIRAKILEALDKNDIEALRIPIDWNEVRPLFAKSGSYRAGTDPVEILKALSFDGRGREILAIMRAVLAQPFVIVTRGPVTLYAWPAFAHQPREAMQGMTPQMQWACVRFADLVRSNAEGKPRPMKLAIASDGVWHYFWSAD